MDPNSFADRLYGTSLLWTIVVIHMFNKFHILKDNNSFWTLYNERWNFLKIDCILLPDMEINILEIRVLCSRVPIILPLVVQYSAGCEKVNVDDVQEWLEKDE
jgi:hypothetical protein